jgi:hypothetical protein
MRTLESNGFNKNNAKQVVNTTVVNTNLFRRQTYGKEASEEAKDKEDGKEGC